MERCAAGYRNRIVVIVFEYAKYIYIYIRTYLHLPIESHVVHKAPFRVPTKTHALRAWRYNRIVFHGPIELLNTPRADRRYSRLQVQTD